MPQKGEEKASALAERASAIERQQEEAMNARMNSLLDRFQVIFGVKGGLPQLLLLVTFLRFCDTHRYILLAGIRQHTKHTVCLFLMHVQNSADYSCCDDEIRYFLGSCKMCMVLKHGFRR